MKNESLFAELSQENAANVNGGFFLFPPAPPTSIFPVPTPPSSPTTPGPLDLNGYFLSVGVFAGIPDVPGLNANENLFAKLAFLNFI